MKHHIAKSFFETFKIYDHMQKIRPIFQTFAEILSLKILRLRDFVVPWPTRHKGHLLDSFLFLLTISEKAGENFLKLKAILAPSSFSVTPKCEQHQTSFFYH